MFRANSTEKPAGSLVHFSPKKEFPVPPQTENNTERPVVLKIRKTGPRARETPLLNYRAESREILQRVVVRLLFLHRRKAVVFFAIHMRSCSPPFSMLLGSFSGACC